jgi:hypothetical protein
LRSIRLSPPTTNMQCPPSAVGSDIAFLQRLSPAQ